MITPRNPRIKISELGEQRGFVSGNKYWVIDWAELSGKRYEEGTLVKWKDLDAQPGEQKTYTALIDWMIIVDDGDVEVSLANTPLGRIPLDELKFIKSATK